MIEENENMPPIGINPEGTTSNGRAILNFKAGAFKNFKPLKILAIKYSNDGFTAFNDKTGHLARIIICGSKWYKNVEIFEFEGTYNPKHLYTKENKNDKD
jgi:hypothetical protein